MLFWNCYAPSTHEILSPVSITFKVEPELEDIVLELAPEAMFVGVLPLSVYNLEGNVLKEFKLHLGLEQSN